MSEIFILLVIFWGGGIEVNCPVAFLSPGAILIYPIEVEEIPSHPVDGVKVTLGVPEDLSPFQRSSILIRVFDSLTFR